MFLLCLTLFAALVILIFRSESPKVVAFRNRIIGLVSGRAKSEYRRRFLSDLATILEGKVFGETLEAERSNFWVEVKFADDASDSAAVMQRILISVHPDPQMGAEQRPHTGWSLPAARADELDFFLSPTTWTERLLLFLGMIRRDSEEREMFGRHFVFHSPNGGAREIVKRRPDFLQELFRVAEGHKCKLAFRNDLVQAHLPVHKGRMPSGKDLISLLDELIHLARLLREIKV